jgi:hypothetical protein
MDIYDFMSIYPRTASKETVLFFQEIYYKIHLCAACNVLHRFSRTFCVKFCVPTHHRLVPAHAYITTVYSRLQYSFHKADDKLLLLIIHCEKPSSLKGGEPSSGPQIEIVSYLHTFLTSSLGLWILALKRNLEVLLVVTTACRIGI